MRTADGRADWLVQPVLAGQLPWLEGASGAPAAEPVEPRLLGQVQLRFSRTALAQERTRALITGAALALLGLGLGGGLALWLARRATQPVQRITELVGRIARGELTARGPELPSDPLLTLQQDLNRMAARLQAGRDELERQIAEATAALREQKDTAEQAVAAKSRFLASASHELRQPTHALGMFVARLAQLPGDPQSRVLIDRLEASVSAMQELLDALFDLARLESQTVRPRIEAVSLGQLFARLGQDLDPTAQAQGLHLRVRPTDLWVMADAVLLQRILTNLLGNALRYTPQGTVLLSGRRSAQGRTALIQVWDSGIGIAPEHHEAVFRDFVQVARPTSGQSQGMGLGLHIVALSARLLGGTLQLRSALGCGTRIGLELPLAPPPGAAPSPQAVLTDHRPLPQGRHVLVLEDDPLSREAVAGLLQAWGFRVRTADNLAAALRVLEDVGVPDLVVTDFQLAEWVNGIDAVRQLRAAAGRKVPACLISGTNTPALQLAAQESGLVLLQKPVRPAKLRALVRRLLAGAADDQDGAAPPR